MTEPLLGDSGSGTVERIAKAFHHTYEKLAPAYGYETRPESAVHWALVPAENKKLMIAVVKTLLDDGTIAVPGPRLRPHYYDGDGAE